ncbi:sugar ABC transporter permease [Shouchella clausii]|uniref:Carbohydrate ABC transporter permease n=1 Tax=Shouchella rhizosphaerae TaxID=866786 RepID=A0ABZ2CVJ0_9BACI|nr:carbohydrate ABC transporter permease [Shouchella clausii]MCM3312965.1 carbohydrate ABC transporter permease [Psychrobacillus sp. MER TA 17]PAE83342.1 ABC transporter permease [Shouchella clausii]PAF09507.1 ABC transporter permease [Shouchella clausii]GIN06244.1 sugar ABC transporter permease [Shouchella clausii]
MKWIGKLGKYVVLAAGLFITLGPFYWMVVGATNSSGALLSVPPNVIPGTHLLENARNLLNNIDMFRALWNSIFITVTFTVIAGLFSAAAGYAFAKYEFKGKNAIFSMFLVSMMIPYQALIIPQFELFARMGILNSYSAIILPQLAYPFAIFLMRQSMKSIPDSVLESARIDGCGEYRMFFQIALPTMLPAIGAVGIFLFTHQWNNFLWPLVVIVTEDMYTLPIVLSILGGQDNLDYGQLMLAATISVLPIFIMFLFLQRYFIAGISSGAVKE